MNFGMEEGFLGSRLKTRMKSENEKNEEGFVTWLVQDA